VCSASDCGTDYNEITYRGVSLQQAGRCCNADVAEMQARMARAMAKVDKDIADAEEEAWRRHAAEAQAAEVELFPESYVGSRPAPRLKKRIETPYFRYQKQARFELKVMTVLEGCSVVQQVTLHEKESSQGNYQYREWAASGIV
jgi:hypothetical protein